MIRYAEAHEVDWIQIFRHEKNELNGKAAQGIGIGVMPLVCSNVCFAPVHILSWKAPHIRICILRRDRILRISEKATYVQGVAFGCRDI